AVNRFEWGVYHIENYLLHPQYIADVLNSLALKTRYDATRVEKSLEEAARSVVPGMVIHRLRAYASSKMVGAIDLGFSPCTATVGQELHAAVSRSSERLSQVVAELSQANLVAMEKKVRAEVEQSFSDRSWMKKLPGREILKRFIALEQVGVAYEVFRNLI